MTWVVLFLLMGLAYLGYKFYFYIPTLRKLLLERNSKLSLRVLSFLESIIKWTALAFLFSIFLGFLLQFIFFFFESDGYFIFYLYIYFGIFLMYICLLVPHIIIRLIAPLYSKVTQEYLSYGIFQIILMVTANYISDSFFNRGEFTFHLARFILIWIVLDAIIEVFWIWKFRTKFSQIFALIILISYMYSFYFYTPAGIYHFSWSTVQGLLGQLLFLLFFSKIALNISIGIYIYFLKKYGERQNSSK